MATSKLHQGKQKGKKTFFIASNKHMKIWNEERKQKEPKISDSDNFFLKGTEKTNSNIGSSLDQCFRRNKEKILKNTESEALSKESKKPFDKKKYRLKKYSKKYRVQQWEERRKKAVIREYYREIKDDPPNANNDFSYGALQSQMGTDQQINEELDNDINVDIAEKQLEPQVKMKKCFRKPHEEFQTVQEEKQKRKQDVLKHKVEKEEARRKAQKERIERSRKLSRKTKRGQPVMKYRMEMLLDKIQKSMNQ